MDGSVEMAASRKHGGDRAGIDLKRHLLLRVTLFAVVVALLGSALVLQQASQGIRNDIHRSGAAIEQLIARELDRQSGAFDRGTAGLRLTRLDQLAQLLGLCIEVQDLILGPDSRQCFSPPRASPAPVRLLLEHWLDDDVRYRGMIGQRPGIKVGEFVVTPDLDAEAAELWRDLRLVLAVSASVLLLNLLIYLPVRTALRPTERILAAIARMESGELSARMPRPRLVELRRICEGFDHLAERLQHTDRAQRRLAKHLVTAREQERRRLARELHDEFGQCLASIRAEVAFVGEGVAPAAVGVQDALAAISRTTDGMIGSVRRIVRELRPAGLEEFGLAASLERLADHARRALPGCDVRLQVSGDLSALPDELAVSVYRIVQEGLTNAIRHGRPSRVRATLCRDRSGLRVVIEDDGVGGADSAVEAGEGGFGVFGMAERVEAFGGRFALRPGRPAGTVLQADFPETAVAAAAVAGEGA